MAKEEEAQVDKQKEKRKWQFLAPIAKPLATKKLNKKALKLVKQAAKSKQLKRGVKEVVKALRKGSKGLCLIAGDISPIDVITHVPILCEEANVPYVYVPSKEELGTAGATKRPTSCMLILPVPPKSAGAADGQPSKMSDEFEEIVKEVNELSASVFSTAS